MELKMLTHAYHKLNGIFLIYSDSHDIVHVNTFLFKIDRAIFDDEPSNEFDLFIPNRDTLNAVGKESGSPDSATSHENDRNSNKSNTSDDENDLRNSTQSSDTSDDENSDRSNATEEEYDLDNFLKKGITIISLPK